MSLTPSGGGARRGGVVAGPFSDGRFGPNGMRGRRVREYCCRLFVDIGEHDAALIG